MNLPRPHSGAHLAWLALTAYASSALAQAPITNPAPAVSAHENPNGANDKYPNFATLAATEPNDPTRGTYLWRIQDAYRGSLFTVMAIHGGKIEPGTSELAREIASADMNIYLFEALKPTGNTTLHITSRNFDERSGRELADHSVYGISVHGFADTATKTCLGGLNTPLRSRLKAEINRWYQTSPLAAGLRAQTKTPAIAFEGTDVPATDVCQFKFMAIEPANIVNHPTRQGVQMEMSRPLRDYLSNSPQARAEYAALIRQTALSQAIADGYTKLNPNAPMAPVTILAVSPVDGRPTLTAPWTDAPISPSSTEAEPE